MSTKTVKETGVARPEPDALTSSVLDHATIKEVTSFGLRNNDGLWPSYNCLDTTIPTPMCPDPVAEKAFGFASWVPAFEFAMYGGAQCSAVGLDVNDQESEVGRVFRRNEGRGVEEALRDIRFVAPDSDAEVQWDEPVDLTPTSSDLTLAQAVAVLEGYAAAVYAGAPTLHLPRAAVPLLGSDVLVWRGNKAFTVNGSKVAIGGGYDQFTVPPSGEWDLYATGEVYVERSSEVLIQSYVLPGDGSGIGSDENGLPDNTVVTLAERMYRVAVDCFVAKATGTVW